MCKPCASWVRTVCAREQAAGRAVLSRGGDGWWGVCGERIESEGSSGGRRRSGRHRSSVAGRRSAAARLAHRTPGASGWAGVALAVRGTDPVWRGKGASVGVGWSRAHRGRRRGMVGFRPPYAAPRPPARRGWRIATRTRCGMGSRAPEGLAALDLAPLKARHRPRRDSRAKPQPDRAGWLALGGWRWGRRAEARPTVGT